MFEAVVAQGLMEGLYRHTDPDMQAMMRMYEFVEIDGLLALDVFGEREPRLCRKPAVPDARSLVSACAPGSTGNGRWTSWRIASAAIGHSKQRN